MEEISDKSVEKSWEDQGIINNINNLNWNMMAHRTCHIQYARKYRTIKNIYWIITRGIIAVVGIVFAVLKLIYESTFLDFLLITVPPILSIFLIEFYIRGNWERKCFKHLNDGEKITFLTSAIIAVNTRPPKNRPETADEFYERLNNAFNGIVKMAAPIEQNVIALKITQLKKDTKRKAKEKKKAMKKIAREKRKEEMSEDESSGEQYTIFEDDSSSSEEGGMSFLEISDTTK